VETLNIKHLFSRRPTNRIVLFSSKGKAAEKKTASAGFVKKTNAETNQQNIIDFATLALWYSEQNSLNDAEKEWNTPRIYAEKQKYLKFMIL